MGPRLSVAPSCAPLLLLFAAAAAAAETTLVSDHVYAAGAAESGERSGIIGYWRCKPNCHLLDRRRAVVRSSLWGGLQGAEVHLEETAGWIVLWRDAAFTVPLLPSRGEYEGVMHNGERGYLRGQTAMVLELHGQP
eukprot:TRINITY_DN15825_c4_g1_i1.p2 TRINITY_DN15825_c4_g1~~TRINITY_DN15825_c4_g1_i1.p2  ORF type:complete len:155 (+),score=42.47 TRINITY_DN15825_c4_g1_i1:59-466(+)